MRGCGVSGGRTSCPPKLNTNCTTHDTTAVEVSGVAGISSVNARPS